MPAVGGESGETRCQGDMEKADMVDGTKLTFFLFFFLNIQSAEAVRLISFASFPFTTGIKESVCWTPPPEVNPNKTCEYQALCSRFKDMLTLPGGCFIFQLFFPRLHLDLKRSVSVY